MRIQGIHVQGLRRPRGEHRIALDPHYNVVQAPDGLGAERLADLLLCLLFPDAGLPDAQHFVDPLAGRPSRVGVALQTSVASFRVIADLEKQRVALGRWDEEGRRFRSVSTRAGEISAALLGAGRMDREDFQALCVLRRVESYVPSELFPPRRAGPARTATRGTTEASATTAVVLPEPAAKTEVDAPRVDPPATSAATRAALEQRWERLRGARQSFLRLEREYKRLLDLCHERAPVADAMEEIDARIERYRELASWRREERAGIEAERVLLLEDRSRLRAVPHAQRALVMLGFGLAAVSAAGGFLVAPWLYGVAVGGLLAGAIGLVVAERARRRVGRIDALLSALRMRETSVERRFEADTSTVRSLLQLIGTDSVDALVEEVATHRERLAELEGLRTRLEEARRAFPEEAEEELRSLDEQLGAPAATPSPAADPSSSVVPAAAPAPVSPAPELAELESAVRAAVELAPGAEPLPERHVPSARGEPGTALDELPEPAFSSEVADLQKLLSAAAHAAVLSPRALDERLRPVLPLYLKVLSDGRFSLLRHSRERGWILRVGPNHDPVPLGSLDETLQGRIVFALQLALVECIAPEVPISLIVGPELPIEDARQAHALARAFRRVSKVAQVVQFTSPDAAFREHATRTQQLHPDLAPAARA